jgi:hypothetical protein
MNIYTLKKKFSNYENRCRQTQKTHSYGDFNFLGRLDDLRKRKTVLFTWMRYEMILDARFLSNGGINLSNRLSTPSVPRNRTSLKLLTAFEPILVFWKGGIDKWWKNEHYS